MDINPIIEVIQTIPFFVWIILGVFILFLFGDKQLWEYEVKFPFKEDIGRGEIEIEYYKKAKGSIDIELQLEIPYVNEALELFLDNKKILDLSMETTANSKLRIHEKFDQAEPHEGMIVEIKHNNQTIMSGPLIMN